MNASTTKFSKEIESLSFEEALSQLEDIVRKLDQGNIPLELAIDFYMKGNELKQHCSSILANAKLKVEKIIANEGVVEAVEEFKVE